MTVGTVAGLGIPGIAGTLGNQIIVSNEYKLASPYYLGVYVGYVNTHTDKGQVNTWDLVGRIGRIMRIFPVNGIQHYKIVFANETRFIITPRPDYYFCNLMRVDDGMVEYAYDIPLNELSDAYQKGVLIYGYPNGYAPRR